MRPLFLCYGITFRQMAILKEKQLDLGIKSEMDSVL